MKEQASHLYPVKLLYGELKAVLGLWIVIVCGLCYLMMAGTSKRNKVGHGTSNVLTCITFHASQCSCSVIGFV